LDTRRIVIALATTNPMPIMLSLDSLLSANLVENMATPRKVNIKDVRVGLSPVIKASAIPADETCVTATLTKTILFKTI
jgi:hypothetical protein